MPLDRGLEVADRSGGLDLDLGAMPRDLLDGHRDRLGARGGGHAAAHGNLRIAGMKRVDFTIFTARLRCMRDCQFSCPLTGLARAARARRRHALLLVAG